MHILRIAIFLFVTMGLTAAEEVQEPAVAKTEVAEESIIKEVNAQAKNGEYTQALNTLNVALANDNQNPRLYKLRGHVYYAMEDYARALSDLNRVVALVPDSANAYADRAIVHSVLGHHALAISDADAALAINPKSVFVLSVRNQVLERAGQ